MASDYYATFAPVAGTRSDLADVLAALLFEMNAPVDVDCYRLALTNNHLRYTDEAGECSSVENAIESTQAWDGLEVHFVYVERMCSVLLWNDVQDATTVVFCEPESLHAEQIEDPAARQRLARTLAVWMTRLRSSFCVLEKGCAFRTRTRDDILRWLDDLRNNRPRDWSMAIVREALISSDSVPAAVRDAGCFRRCQEHGFWMLSMIGEIGVDNLHVDDRLDVEVES